MLNLYAFICIWAFTQVIFQAFSIINALNKSRTPASCFCCMSVRCDFIVEPVNWCRKSIGRTIYASCRENSTYGSRTLLFMVMAMVICYSFGCFHFTPSISVISDLDLNKKSLVDYIKITYRSTLTWSIWVLQSFLYFKML